MRKQRGKYQFSRTGPGRNGVLKGQSIPQTHFEIVVVGTQTVRLSPCGPLHPPRPFRAGPPAAPNAGRSPPQRPICTRRKGARRLPDGVANEAAPRARARARKPQQLRRRAATPQG